MVEDEAQRATLSTMSNTPEAAPALTDYVVAPVRIIQNVAYPIHLLARVRYDGEWFTVVGVERNATVLRLAADNDPTGVRSFHIVVG